ncbi:hypothetical protein MKW94_023948 [Papaver nudicaule]|uniref:K Homology domain-containing protein n=1 Tax=Papaver nudicaule TaxID=74823 RepID=A0AA41V555_PAPNU|nr:hypothetical protein [Papaver nudicaule]
MCEDTRARIRVLDGALGTNDRIVILISSKEEPEARLSPAMNAVIRVFRRITGLSETDGEGSSSGGAVCSFRLLVASSQAINLIGKQGSLIKSIQESSAATVRVLSGEEVPHYATSDERIVEIQGEASKVLKALEAIVGHLRKFLVDHSVIPLFEKTGSAPTTQDRVTDIWVEKPQTLLHPPMVTDKYLFFLSLSQLRESKGMPTIKLWPHCGKVSLLPIFSISMLITFAFYNCRYCLWILGNGRTLMDSDSVWSPNQILTEMPPRLTISLMLHLLPFMEEVLQ